MLDLGHLSTHAVPVWDGVVPSAQRCCFFVLGGFRGLRQDMCKEFLSPLLQPRAVLLCGHAWPKLLLQTLYLEVRGFS